MFVDHNLCLMKHNHTKCNRIIVIGKTYYQSPEHFTCDPNTKHKQTYTHTQRNERAQRAPTIV